MSRKLRTVSMLISSNELVDALRMGTWLRSGMFFFIAIVLTISEAVANMNVNMQDIEDDHNSYFFLSVPPFFLSSPFLLNFLSVSINFSFLTLFSFAHD